MRILMMTRILKMKINVVSKSILMALEIMRTMLTNMPMMAMLRMC